MHVDNYWSSRLARRLNRRNLLLSSGAAGIALAAAACSSKSNGSSGTSSSSSSGAVFKPQKGGTLTFATTTPDNWVQTDPHTALIFSIWQIISRNAVRLDGDTKKITGQAVEKWEVPGDGSQFILHVRPNLKIQNKPPASGRTFTAEDLAFNINRIAGKLDPQHFALYQRAATMYGLDHTEVVDPLTVKVVMQRPSATFLNGLAHHDNAMLPKDVVDADPQLQNWNNFAGIGPFQVKDYQKGGTLSLVRNPDFFEQGLPYADEIDWLTLPDTATKVSAFLSGKIDMYEEPDSATVPTIKAARPDAKLFKSGGLNWYHFRFHTQKQPFTDARVRRALFLALDYKDIGDGAWGDGWGYTGAMVPAHPEAFTEDQLKQLPGLNSSTKDKDRQTAKQLMTAAGYPDGEISWPILLSSTLPTNAATLNATRAQDQWKKLWSKINPTLQPPPDSATFAKLQATNDFSMIAYTNTAFQDAALEMGAQWHTLNGVLGSRNYGQFKNADADAMIEKALVTIDFDQRKQILQDFEKRWFDEWMPLIPVHTGADRYYTGPHFGNFDNLLGTWWMINFRLLTLAERFSRTQ
jgi:peptide/nickel transport system substrate-binding protein